jgi:hypothetical protein
MALRVVSLLVTAKALGAIQGARLQLGQPVLQPRSLMPCDMPPKT